MDTDLAEKRQTLIASLGIEYSAEFVPFSKSRNAKEKHKSLNWIVTLRRGAQSIATDYMQGIAHAPIYNNPPKHIGRNTADHVRLINHEAESGTLARYMTSWDGITKKGPIPAPALEDVLYCLISDSDVLNYSGFEDWAESLGMDSDSRKEEKIYQQCMSIALKLRAMLGDANIEALRESFQDY